MFGKNQIVGQAFFDKSKDKYLVTTIFGPTIQGEGPLAGKVAMFIRLAKCNLACSFCDTYFDSGDWMTIEEIENKLQQRINDYYNPNGVGVILRPHSYNMALIISGGEPTLQKLYPLLKHLEGQFSRIQIESNGILNVPLPDHTMLVVSPKCLEKNGKSIKYLMPNPGTLKRANCLKFVITAEEDSPYHTIPDWALKWLFDDGEATIGREIYISPMNMYLDEPKDARAAIVGKNELTLDERSIVNEVISFWEPGLLDMKQNQANHEYAARYCVNNGLRLSLQQHLYAGLA